MQLRAYVAAADVDARLDSQRGGGRGGGGGEETSTEESALYRLGPALYSFPLSPGSSGSPICDHRKSNGRLCLLRVCLLRRRVVLPARLLERTHWQPPGTSPGSRGPGRQFLFKAISRHAIVRARARARIHGRELEIGGRVRTRRARRLDDSQLRGNAIRRGAAGARRERKVCGLRDVAFLARHPANPRDEFSSGPVAKKRYEKENPRFLPPLHLRGILSPPPVPLERSEWKKGRRGGERVRERVSRQRCVSVFLIRAQRETPLYFPFFRRGTEKKERAPKEGAPRQEKARSIHRACVVPPPPLAPPRAPYLQFFQFS